MAAQLGPVLSRAGSVFRKEVREGLRNRRALFFAFGLPLLLYPSLVFLFSALEKQHFDVMERRSAEVSVIVTDEPDSLSSRAMDWLRADPAISVRREVLLQAESIGLSAPASFLDPWEELDPDTAGTRDLLSADSSHALILLAPLEDRGRDQLPVIGVFFEGTSEESFAMVRKITTSLDSLRSELFDERARQAGVLNPWRDIVLVVHDSSIRTARSGKYLGSILPMLVMFIALTGGSYIALDAIAGERERRTLEALLAQPVHRMSIVLGKALAVLCASLVAVLTACLGLLAGSQLLPFGAGAAMEGIELAFPEPSSLAAAFGAALPLVLQVAAALMIVTSMARSYKEAQNYLLPLTLLMLVAGMMVTSLSMEHTLTLSLIPIAGQAFAFRELLAGGGDPSLVALSMATGVAWGLLGLFWASRLLSGEGVLLTRAGNRPPRRVSPAKRAVALGLAVLLGLYYPSVLLTAWPPLLGIAVTEWVFLMLVSIGFAVMFGLKPAELGMRSAPSRGLLLSLTLAAPLAAVAWLLLYLQSLLLPVPDILIELMRPLEQAGVLESILVLVLTPAICEELLFRGVILRQLAREISRPRAVLVSAILFGVFHLSIYRFVPTFAVGLVLGWLAIATGSIVPPILLHAAYNLMTTHLLPESFSAVSPFALVLLPSVVISGIVILGGRFRGGRSGPSA